MRFMGRKSIDSGNSSLESLNENPIKYQKYDGRGNSDLGDDIRTPNTFAEPDFWFMLYY